MIINQEQEAENPKQKGKLYISVSVNNLGGRFRSVIHQCLLQIPKKSKNHEDKSIKYLMPKPLLNLWRNGKH